MVVLVAAETVVLALLAVLVAALLRSHAEILRRLPPPEDAAGTPGSARSLGLPVVPDGGPRGPAPEIVGTTLAGDAVKVSMRAGGGTLLAFLSSGCRTCRGLWESLRSDGVEALPGGARLVVVTRGPDMESPSRLRDEAPTGVPVVMSSAAWQDYDVPMTPYFVFVAGPAGVVTGQGTAERWSQVVSLLQDAVEDGAMAMAGGDANGSGRDGRARARRIDDELRLAGIGPGHPSLYEADGGGAR